jgi:hypothetical protein
MEHLEIVDGGGGLQIQRVAVKIFNNNSCGQPGSGGPPTWGLDEGLTTPHRKKQLRNAIKGLGRGPL